MASESNFEVMEHDGDVDADTIQVQVPNELFDVKGGNDEEALDFEEEADDLEITEFATTDKNLSKGNMKTGPNRTPSRPAEITISVVEPQEDSKEDGEISENQSHSDNSDDDDNNQQYLSRSSSTRSSQRRKNDIRRERSPVARQYPNPYLEVDEAKIQSRAVRFGLANASALGAPNIEHSAQLSDEDLINFYLSCGLIYDDGGKLTVEKVGPHHRLDSILIRGTNHMNTNEIFKYLYDLGHKPLTMEWVNDAMCVVIFKDKYEAALSLMKTSKPIAMDPRIVERKRSIVQSMDNDKDKDENSEEKADPMVEDFDYDKVDVIPQSVITVPMPPGYAWRLGAPCEKAKGILVRFANKHDKKQERAERFSEFYKNYGNPNKYGNTREYSGNEKSRGGRKKIRSEQVTNTDRNERSESGVPQLSMLNANDKNGWGQLSAMWDDEEAYQRSARDRLTSVKQSPTKESENSTLGISPMKKVETSMDLSAKPVDAREFLQTRQKRKRGTNSSDDEDNDDSDDIDNILNVNDWKDGSFRRKRNSKVDDDDGEMAWRERLSGPRMRMHADEEEERMKRRAYRRLGQKRGGEGSFQNNSWEFSRDNSHNSSIRYKSSQQRRPISERLGAKRNQGGSFNNNDDVRLETEDLEQANAAGFDLRQKLVNMRRTGGNDEGDEEDDLRALIFQDNLL